MVVSALAATVEYRSAGRLARNGPRADPLTNGQIRRKEDIRWPVRIGGQGPSMAGNACSAQMVLPVDVCRLPHRSAT